MAGSAVSAAASLALSLVSELGTDEQLGRREGAGLRPLLEVGGVVMVETGELGELVMAESGELGELVMAESGELGKLVMAESGE